MGFLLLLSARLLLVVALAIAPEVVQAAVLVALEVVLVELLVLLPLAGG